MIALKRRNPVDLLSMTLVELAVLAFFDVILLSTVVQLIWSTATLTD